MFIVDGNNNELLIAGSDPEAAAADAAAGAWCAAAEEGGLASLARHRPRDAPGVSRPRQPEVGSY